LRGVFRQKADCGGKRRQHRGRFEGGRLAHRFNGDLGYQHGRAFQICGRAPANTMEELFDIASVLSNQPLPKGRNWRY